jgi:8-oxo-dGTP pyrophosphatase MutT (NUDIX family)
MGGLLPFSNSSMALRFDPQKLPVIGIDDHLPAATPAVLHGDALRQRFLTPPVWTPEIKTDGRFTDRTPTHASVLIALVPRAETTVLLTQRTDHLTDHPGQISFPGGRVDPGDADAAATALREAHEEIGLEADFVDVLGAMPTYTTGTGFIVTPVVALVRPGFAVQPEPFEVAEVFEVPLAFLMNPANHRRHVIELDGGAREFLSMPWEGLDESGRPRRYFIWGATAAMLRNLYRFLMA